MYRHSFAHMAIKTVAREAEPGTYAIDERSKNLPAPPLELAAVQRGFGVRRVLLPARQVSLPTVRYAGFVDRLCNQLQRLRPAGCNALQHRGSNIFDVTLKHRKETNRVGTVRLQSCLSCLSSTFDPLSVVDKYTGRSQFQLPYGCRFHGPGSGSSWQSTVVCNLSITICRPFHLCHGPPLAGRSKKTWRTWVSRYIPLPLQPITWAC